MTLTHINLSGDPTMVDVSDKANTHRTATAQAKVNLTPEIIDLMENDDIISRKGPVEQTAILAGIMAAKRTSDLIPLCHPLSLSNCRIDITINEDNALIIQCTASITAKTGVEMEALMGASVAALTVYDMCKSYSHGITITDIKLLSKTGGKSDYQDG